MAKHRAPSKIPHKGLILFAVLLFLLPFALWAATAIGHSDPYCGPGMNWDWIHQICQPGNPVPYPPYYPPNSPSPYPPYAGPTSIPDWQY